MSRRKRGRPSQPETPRGRARHGVWWGVLAGVLIVAAGVALRWGGVTGRPKGPNLLLITVDTTRADHLGCYGRVGARTPVLDGLARDGARFTRCSACTPLTLPSHASIMTGVYPYVHGARQNGTGRLAGSNVTLAEALQEGEYATQATVAAFVLNRKFGVSQGFDVYRDVVVKGTGDPLDAERKGDEVCDDACEMLRGLAQQRFFLWVHFYDPHHPYESEQHADPNSIEAYEDEIAFMDRQIGRLLAELRRLGLEDDTLVVVVGDHGEGLGDHGEPRHGMFLYDTTLHVPLIMRKPGLIAPARTITANIRTIDIAPTILALLERPALDRAQGVSLAPLLQGAPSYPGLAAYSETFEPQVSYGASQLRSLLFDGWKYILAPKAELYHLVSDPEEQVNRLDEESGRADALCEQMRELIANAPPPASDGDLINALDASDIARLESLGYVASDATPADRGATELDRFEPRGPNPRDMVPVLEEVARARAAARAGDYGQAVQLFRRLIEQVPEATRLQADLADALGGAGRVAEAIATYEAAVAMAPDDRYVRRMYARYLMRIGKLEDAVTQYAAMLAGAPDDTTALHEIGVALTRLGRFTEAEAHLKAALEVEPDTPRLLHAMGLLRWNEKRYMEAAPYFRRALEIDPGFSAARDALQKLQEAGLPTRP